MNKHKTICGVSWLAIVCLLFWAVVLATCAGCGAMVSHESRTTIPAGTTITVTDEGGVTTTTEYAADAVIVSKLKYCRLGDQEIQGLDIVFASGAGVELNKQRSQMGEFVESIATLMPLFKAILVPVP